jgi:hypothetical protein
MDSLHCQTVQFNSNSHGIFISHPAKNIITSFVGHSSLHHKFGFDWQYSKSSGSHMKKSVSKTSGLIDRYHVIMAYPLRGDVYHGISSKYDVVIGSLISVHQLSSSIARHEIMIFFMVVKVF